MEKSASLLTRSPGTGMPPKVTVPPRRSSPPLCEKQRGRNFTLSKRRKTSTSSQEEDTKSVSSSGGELDLSSFDYDEMDKLAINSDEAEQSSEDGSDVSV
jgi:hypothetical protein